VPFGGFRGAGPPAPVGGGVGPDDARAGRPPPSRLLAPIMATMTGGMTTKGTAAVNPATTISTMPA
jgi:hypothetical protein